MLSPSAALYLKFLTSDKILFFMVNDCQEAIICGVFYRGCYINNLYTSMSKERFPAVRRGFISKCFLCKTSVTFCPVFGLPHIFFFQNNALILYKFDSKYIFLLIKFSFETDFFHFKVICFIVIF